MAASKIDVTPEAAGMLRTLAARLDISAMGIYHYFDSKNDLLGAVQGLERLVKGGDGRGVGVDVELQSGEAVVPRGTVGDQRVPAPGRAGEGSA